MDFLRLFRKFLVPAALALLATACSPVRPLRCQRPSQRRQRQLRPVALPPAVEYNLGDATIIQERFPEDSRFRNMPVRLNGVIAAPEAGGPYPVVLILHGTHPGCPEVEHGVDRWPCDPAVEQPNYRGFA